MPILYQWPQDEDQVVGQPQTTFFAEDNNAEWWNGVFQLGARVALAAILAITGTQTAQAAALANAHQDDPAATLSGTSNHDEYWQNPNQPLLPGSYGPLYLPDPEEIPAAQLHAPPDEVYWQQGPPFAVPASIYQQLPYLPDPEEIPATQLSGTSNHDEPWQNPAAPVSGSLLWPQQWTFDEQIPSGNLTATVDEYFWTNPVAPVPLTFGPLYLPDPEEIPVAQLTATVDEYFWQNPTASVPATLGPIYLPDPEEIPAAQLSATVDEYYWQNPVAPIPYYTPPLAFRDDDVIVPQPQANQPDEDFWANPVAPTSWTFLFQQWIGDEQTPALFPQPDEDFWINPTPPIAGMLSWPQQWVFEQNAEPGALFGQFDEDFWTNPTSPVPGSLLVPQQPSFDEQSPILFGQYDEDFWQNPTPPVVGSLVYPQQWSFDEQFPTLYGQFDEDFWANPTSLVAPSVFIAQPLFDSSDIVPQPPPSVQPEEDFWQNPALPALLTAASLTLVPQPFAFDDAIIVPFVPPHFAAVERIIVLRDVHPGIRIRPS